MIRPNRMLLGLTIIALFTGLILVFSPGGDSGWFTYAPESEAGEALGITFTAATLVTDRDMYGYALIAVAAIIGAGLFGYRLGSRRNG